MPIDGQENQETAAYRAQQHAMFNMFTPDQGPFHGEGDANESPRMHQDIGHIVDDSPADHLNYYQQFAPQPKHPCANVAPFEEKEGDETIKTVSESNLNQSINQSESESVFSDNFNMRISKHNLKKNAEPPGNMSCMDGNAGDTHSQGGGHYANLIPHQHNNDDKASMKSWNPVDSIKLDMSSRRPNVKIPKRGGGGKKLANTNNTHQMIEDDAAHPRITEETSGSHHSTPDPIENIGQQLNLLQELKQQVQQEEEKVTTATDAETQQTNQEKPSQK